MDLLNDYGSPWGMIEMTPTRSRGRPARQLSASSEAFSPATASSLIASRLPLMNGIGQPREALQAEVGDVGHGGAVPSRRRTRCTSVPTELVALTDERDHAGAVVVGDLVDDRLLASS